MCETKRPLEKKEFAVDTHEDGAGTGQTVTQRNTQIGVFLYNIFFIKTYTTPLGSPPGCPRRRCGPRRGSWLRHPSDI